LDVRTRVLDARQIECCTTQERHSFGFTLAQTPRRDLAVGLLALGGVAEQDMGEFVKRRLVRERIQGRDRDRSVTREAPMTFPSVTSNGVDVASDLADEANADPDPAIDQRRVNARIAEANPQIRSELRAIYGDPADNLLNRFREWVEASPRVKAVMACGSRIANCGVESRIRQRCLAPHVCPTLTRR
jgi:hypothetical protein